MLAGFRAAQSSRMTLYIMPGHSSATMELLLAQARQAQASAAVLSCISTSLPMWTWGFCKELIIANSVDYICGADRIAGRV